jgi:methionyl-tRNA formyltransferase
LTRAIFPGTVAIKADRRETLSEIVHWDRSQILLSFLYPSVIPRAILERHSVAINFHPGSTDYPGVGCYNFALYDRAAEYGCVCHHMAEKVDTGPIVDERRFPIFDHDTVETLRERALSVMVAQLHEVLCLLATGREPPQVNAHWSRAPYTRKELDELTRITSDMTASEIARRVRATTYPGQPGPYVVIGGVTFRSENPASRNALDHP